jgi:nucleotide-binding universal stress UspA family protein
MNRIVLNMPFVKSVFHPTDFSEPSMHAFAHALAISLNRQTHFTIMHAAEEDHSLSHFPSIRQTLVRWGLADANNDTADILEELNLRVKKINLKTTHPLKSIVAYLQTTPTDLIVLATEGREGLARWIRPSMAERIAHRSETMTLFVPHKSRGFVSLDDGKFCLKRILIPVDFHPSPLPAIEYALRAAKCSDKPVEIVLCHVGNEWKMSSLELPEEPGITWIKKFCSGNIVRQLINLAHIQEINLIAMSTAGLDGVFDALRGSVTDQILREAPCPLLAVPVN